MNNLEPYFRKKDVSPVIGVILLVALVVALITLATVVVFNIGDESAQEAADTAIDITQTSSGIQARVISNNNVDEYQINFPDGNQQTLDGDVGNSINLVGPEGLYTIVAVLEDGSEQTIITQEISGLDYSGVFVVEQYKESGEVEAVLAQEFDNIEDYDLTLKTNEDGDTTTELQSLDFASQSSLLADELVNEQLGSENTVRATVLELISIQSEPGDNAIGIGERIAVHEMVNLCKGDELQLEDSNDGDVLASETILVDNDCNLLRKVAQYENGEISALQLFNLWNQELDYFAFQFDGQPQPDLPSMPTPTTDDGDGITLEAYVHKEGDYDEAIQGATVVVGDMTEQTDSDGYAVFENIDAGEEGTASTDINSIDATAYRDGYKPAGVRAIPENEVWSEETHQEDFELTPIEQFDEPSFVDDEEGPTISPGGEPRTVNIGSSSGGGGGIVIGGGGSVGGGITSSLGGFYGGGGASTSTFSETTPSFNETVPTVTESVQPERLFNVIEIDESLIPTGGEFRIDTTVRATGEEDLTDDVNIYMSPTDVEQVQLMRSTSAVLPSDGTNTVEDEFTVGEGDAEKLEAGQEYVIYVDLEDSDTPLQSAGTLDVFDGAREGATIDGGEVEPERPTIVEDSEETIDVTVDDSYIDFNDASAVTVDIFENGYRVAEGEISKDSEDTVTYEGTYSEQQYVQFHVGVQESQDVAILDTVLVREEVDSPDINQFETEIEITNSDDDCDIDTRTSGQFDCEVDITDEDHFVGFDGSGSTFTDSGGDALTDLTYKWVLGSDDVEEFTQEDIDNDEEDLMIEHTFEEDTTHLVELRVETEIDGETYDARDTKFVNAVDDTARFESTISDTDITNVDDVSVTILNTKETAAEVVDLQYYKDDDGDISRSNKEESDKLIEVVEDIRVGADSTTQINNNEIDYTDFVADDEVDNLEAGDTIPFEVAVRPAEGERYDKEDEGPWVTKDLEFVVPESSIEITEATATIQVCYDGSCEE